MSKQQSTSLSVLTSSAISIETLKLVGEEKACHMAYNAAKTIFHLVKTYGGTTQGDLDLMNQMKNLGRQWLAQMKMFRECSPVYNLFTNRDVISNVWSFLDTTKFAAIEPEDYKTPGISSASWYICAAISDTWKEVLSTRV